VADKTATRCGGPPVRQAECFFMWLRDETGALSAWDRQWLEREVLHLGSLQDVVRYAFSATPPRDVREVVVQDEYSHDVVMMWRDGLVLAFETT
jgi:hypothetical protein